MLRNSDIIYAYIAISLFVIKIHKYNIEKALIAKFIIVYILFVPLLIIVSFYGLINYKNMISKLHKVKTDVVEEPPSSI